MKIDDKTIEQIKQIPIEDVVPLKYRTSYNKKLSLCPLHGDTSPSFVIYPTNTFFCFGCREGGDIIDLIMKLSDVSFRDACEYLSKYL